MLQAAASGSQDPEISQDEEGSDAEEEQAEGVDSRKEGLAISESTPGHKGKEAKSGTIRNTRRDMYKAFDGSALLCIGTLCFLCAYLVIANSAQKQQGHYFSHTLLPR